MRTILTAPRSILLALIAAAGCCIGLSQRGTGQEITPRKETNPLITRGQVKLNLAGAELVVVEARKKADAMKVRLNIAVVDDGGHLLAFARMDGARPASGYTAMTKATAAATMRTATGPVPPGAPNPDPLLNIALQHTAAIGGGKMTTLYGGVPIVLDGQVIGAVGCGGGTGEQDAEVARAGIAALVREIDDKTQSNK